MISIAGAVSILIYLLVAMVIFGLCLFLVNYIAGQFPSVAPFAGVARIVLMVLAVLVLIGFLLSLISDRPLFRP